jgi:hypothetical protein
MVHVAGAAANKHLHQQQHWRVTPGCEWHCELAAWLLWGNQQALAVKHLQQQTAKRTLVNTRSQLDWHPMLAEE